MSQLQKPRPALTFFISVTPSCTAIRQLEAILTLIVMVSKLVTMFQTQVVSADLTARVRILEEGKLGRGALAVGGEALGQAIEAHWPSDGEALRDVAVHFDEKVENVPMFDAFGNDFASKRVGKSNS